MTYTARYDLNDPLPPKEPREIDPWDDLDEEPQEDPVPDDRGPNHSGYRPGGY